MAAQDRRVDADLQRRTYINFMKNLFIVFLQLIVLLVITTANVAMANDPAPAKPAADSHGAPAKKEEKKDDHGAPPKRMTTVRLPKTLMALLLRRKSDLNGPLKAKNHCFTLTPKDAPTLNHFTKPKKKNISSAEV